MCIQKKLAFTLYILSNLPHRRSYSVYRRPSSLRKNPDFLREGGVCTQANVLRPVKLQRTVNEYAVKCRIYERPDQPKYTLSRHTESSEFSNSVCLRLIIIYTLWASRKISCSIRREETRLTPLDSFKLQVKIKNYIHGRKNKTFCLTHAERWEMVREYFNLFILSLSVDREKQESISDSWQKIKNENRLLLMYIWTPQLLN